jgi:hypothetical protein
MRTSSALDGTLYGIAEGEANHYALFVSETP